MLLHRKKNDPPLEYWTIGKFKFYNFTIFRFYHLKIWRDFQLSNFTIGKLENFRFTILPSEKLGNWKFSESVLGTRS